MIYDYKSKSTVQDVILDGIDKLTSDIEDEFSSLRRYQYLLIYSPAFLAREIIGEILDDEDDTWVNDDAHFELLHDDDNEVLITLAYDGMIFIEEARSDKGQLKISDFSALTYVYDRFSKRDVDCLTSEGESVLVFGFDDGVLDEDEFECDGECDDCQYADNNKNESLNEDICECDDNDDDVHGFTVSKSDEHGYSSYSFYTSEVITKNDIKDFLKDLGFVLN